MRCRMVLLVVFLVALVVFAGLAWMAAEANRDLAYIVNQGK